MTVDYLDAARAIDQGEFLPHFQPVVNLRTGELQGFELLARWNHPEQGWIPPDEFVPSAERDGWIDRLTTEILRKGFSAAVPLPRTLTLAVNISPVQLHNLNLPHQIQAVAELTGFSLDRLTVEVTESALMEDMDRARTTALALKAIGCRLALDDFGTGYSSLSHLQSLPFDELKVDRSFVNLMTKQRDSRKIVAAVVGLGQSLALNTVAEGIETQEQFEMLLWLGCELGQGLLYGEPIPAEMLEASASGNPQNMSLGLSNDAMGHVSWGSIDSLPAQRLAQLRAVYDGAPVGLAFLDRNLRYMSLNRRLANMNGKPMEEHLGRTVQEITPELFPLIEPYILRALQGEAIPGVEVTRPAHNPNDNKTFLLTYEPARDEAGEVVGVSVALVDLTPIKRAEAAQQESEDHFRHMIERMPQIPWVTDPQGRAIDVSQRWLEITGMTEDQWRGYGWMDALHPDDRQPTWDAMRRSFHTGHPIDLYFRLRRSEHDPWKRMRSTGSARLGENGEIVCWYGCLEFVNSQ